MDIEGANATMLNIDFGTYPYVTGSNPSIGRVLTGLGVSPSKISGLYGTTKAYCTRVGEEPFPIELDRSKGMKSCRLGRERRLSSGLNGPDLEIKPRRV